MYSIQFSPLAKKDILRIKEYFVEEKNYVFYRLEKETVKIIRIIDARQDYMNILFGDR
jgi:plasmid stabilization system protein ParE